MTEKEKSSYKRRLQEMQESTSVQRMRDYFEAKAGSPEYFNEKSFLNFVKSVKSLVDFMGVTDPDEALRDLNEDVLNRHIKFMREKGNAPGTQRLRITHIKRWARSNGVKLEWDEVVLPRMRPVVNDRAPTKTELRLIMSYAPTWIIHTTLVLASSGMRVGSLVDLTLKHLNRDSFPDFAILEVPPESAKGGIGYYTCITFEALQALEKHLASREKKGEILGPESPLIKSPMANGKTTYAAVESAWNRCLKSAGLDEKSHGTHVLHLHTLRKFFRSQVEGIMTKSIREAMMGHVSGEYLDRNYLRIPEQKMAEWYRKSLSVLTVYEDVQSEEYQRRQLLRQAALLLSPDKLEMLKNIMASERDLDKVVNEYQRMTLQPNNGTYEVVEGEEAMLKRLSEGCKLEKELNGDKYLVRHA